MKLKENLLNFKSFWTDFIFVFSFAALPSFISLPISIELSWSDLRNSLAGFWRIQQIADEACTSMACLRSSRQENHDNTFLKTHTVVFGSKNKTQMVVFLLAQKKTGLSWLCYRINCILYASLPSFPHPHLFLRCSCSCLYLHTWSHLLSQRQPDKHIDWPYWARCESSPLCVRPGTG